jgi:two-component system, CAI-1 autoinducer sensor kinase/phosphatase CqsS
MAPALDSPLAAQLRAAGEFARRHFERVEPNLPAIGLVGIIGFPMYWMVWAWLFPQPYESLTLRMIGAGLCLPIALARFWPRSWRPWLQPWWYGMLTYSLSFFFNYMLIQNEFSIIWQMSTLAATFLLVLLLDWISLTAVFIIGTAAAWIVHALEPGRIVAPDRYFEALPIFLFALIGGTIFNYKAEMLRQERRRAALAFGSNIADEIRSPLSGIKTAAAGLRQVVPALLKTYQEVRALAPPTAAIDARAITGLEHVVDRVWRETEHLTAILDIMLTSAGDRTIDRNRFRRIGMLDCVQGALSRYPFASSRDAARVALQVERDFTFDGSEQLAQFVILTLLRNALYGVTRGGKGSVTITLAGGGESSRVVVRDTGIGMSANELAHVFEGECPAIEPGIANTGAITYCRSVAEAFGGQLECRAASGEFTEFEWRLPAARSTPAPESAAA